MALHSTEVMKDVILQAEATFFFFFTSLLLTSRMQQYSYGVNVWGPITKENSVTAFCQNHSCSKSVNISGGPAGMN